MDFRSAFVIYFFYSKQLFQQCLRTFLKDKIVILVTHQLQYLPYVDKIIYFSKGNIEEAGTYESLRESGVDFSSLLAKHGQNDSDSKDGTLNRIDGQQSHLSMFSSVSSINSLKKERKPNKIEVEEKRFEGSAGFKMYKKYFEATGGYFTFSILIFLCVLAQLFGSIADYYVSYW